MPRFHAVLLWLLMLAVPFQGYAAAAMTFCATEAPAQVPSSASAAHDHAVHARAGVPDHADHADHADQAPDDAQDSPHEGSGCGNCAPCHAVALTSAATAVTSPGLPQADLADPSYAVATASPGVLDRPPRA